MKTASAQADDITRRIGKALEGFAKKDRKRILRSASKPVVRAARSTSAIRDSSKVHYRGKKPKRVAIKPGNLRRSLDRVPGFRGSESEFVGPRFGKRSRKNADGYYAQFLYGKRRKKSGNSGKLARRIFHNKVLLPAAKRSRGSVVKIVTTKSRRAIIRWGRKYNFK